MWCRGERIKEELELIDKELNRILNHIEEDIDILMNANFCPDFKTDELDSFEFARNREIQRLKDFYEANLELRRKWERRYKYNF